MHVKRIIYLGVVPSEARIGIDILSASVIEANEEHARFIHFPFWTQNQDKDGPVQIVNYYIQYDRKKFSFKHWFNKTFDRVQDVIAVNFKDGEAIVLSSIEAGVAVHRKHFNLADPNSLKDLGAYIFLLLARV